MWLQRTGIVFIVGLWGCLGSLPGRAQSRSPVAPASTFSDGRNAFEAGRYREAAETWQPLFEAAPDYVDPAAGSVAYWLGRAYQAQEKAQQATAVWDRGFHALDAAGLFDVRLADAFIWRVFGDREADRYDAGVAAYLGLLRLLEQAPGVQEQALLMPHLVALSVILPERLLTATGLEAVLADGDWNALHAASGTMLIQWWRSQDVLPATADNERLEEHLVRTAYAYAHYTREDDDARLDARGVVYVRLGAPSRQIPITYQGADFAQQVLNRSASITLASFPDGAFWVYDQIGPTAQYLFARTPGSGYHIGEAMDLIPASLRTGLGPTERGRNKALVLIRVMEKVYGQLAHLHTNYASLYADIADYNQLLDHIESEIRAQGRRTRESAMTNPSGEESPDTEVIGGFQQSNVSGAALGLLIAQLPVPPHVFAQNAMTEGRADETAAAHRRDEEVPRVHSDVYGQTESLPVQLHWARFLDADGSTRTELYWSVSAEGFKPSGRLLRQLQSQGKYPQDQYLLTLTVNQLTADYQPRTINITRNLIPVNTAGAAEVLPPQTVVVHGDTATYHLALQWDQQWARLSADAAQTVQAGQRLKIGSYRVDTLQALSNDPGTLEMSDLKPLLLSGRQGSVEDAPPYPFTGIAPDAALGLYFEVYHLTFGADDQTHFSVAYEVTTPERGGLLQRNRDSRITAQTDYTGSDRTAREYIVLDLSALSAQGDVEVMVRVTDTRTGQQVERSLHFEVAR